VKEMPVEIPVKIPVEKDGKVWTGMVSSQYPNKRIVMTDVDWAEDGYNRLIGHIYDVYDTVEEAIKIRDKLRADGVAKVSIIQGHDERLRAGGFILESTA